MIDEKEKERRRLKRLVKNGELPRHMLVKDREEKLERSPILRPRRAGKRSNGVLKPRNTGGFTLRQTDTVRFLLNDDKK